MDETTNDDAGRITVLQDQVKKRKSSKSLVQELLETLLLTLILFAVTRFSVQNYEVQGISMLPTLQDHEVVARSAMADAGASTSPAKA